MNPERVNCDLTVFGMKPDIRREKQLYFKAKVADLSVRSVTGDCSAHGLNSEIHRFCGDSNETCYDCLVIAKEVLEVYNKERILPSKLFRQKVPICTCGVDLNLYEPTVNKKGENESLVLYRLARKKIVGGSNRLQKTLLKSVTVWVTLACSI